MIDLGTASDEDLNALMRSAIGSGDREQLISVLQEKGRRTREEAHAEWAARMLRL